MFASTEELRAMNNVVDSVENDEVAVQLEGAMNPLFSGIQDDGEKHSWWHHYCLDCGLHWNTELEKATPPETVK